MKVKVTQISAHVWKLGIWAFLHVNVWIVRDPKGLILVDGGLRGHQKAIMRFVRELDAGPLQQILLTHGHSDHVGSIPNIAREWDVPVYAHGREIPYMTGKLPYPRRKKAQQTVPADIVRPLPQQDDTLLAAGPLQPYWTPGHSPGHTVFYHRQDRVLIGGDLFTTRGKRLRRPIPMFTSDMDRAVKSGIIVQTLQPELLTVCHGLDIHQPHRQYDAYVRKYGYDLALQDELQEKGESDRCHPKKNGLNIPVKKL